MSNAWQVYIYMRHSSSRYVLSFHSSFLSTCQWANFTLLTEAEGTKERWGKGVQDYRVKRKAEGRTCHVTGDEKKRTYLKCRPRRVIPHCLDVCNEFAYVFECGHSRFSAVLLAASQFIYAPGINVSYAVSAAAKNYVCTATFNVPSFD